MGKREDAAREYVEIASQYHDSWVSHEVTGNPPSIQDTIQGALPHSTSEIDGNWGKHLPE